MSIPLEVLMMLEQQQMAAEQDRRRRRTAFLLLLNPTPASVVDPCGNPTRHDETDVVPR